MSRLKHPVCGTCPHMVPGSAGLGECHHEPPTLGPDDAHPRIGITSWPIVSSKGAGCSRHPQWKSYLVAYANTIREDDWAGDGEAPTRPKLDLFV